MTKHNRISKRKYTTTSKLRKKKIYKKPGFIHSLRRKKTIKAYLRKTSLKNDNFGRVDRADSPEIGLGFYKEDSPEIGLGFYKEDSPEIGLGFYRADSPEIGLGFYKEDSPEIGLGFYRADSSETERQESVTPRKRYVDTYLNKPVFLTPGDLFQVSIDPAQIIHYKKITEHTNIECFIQSLFVLGLRDLTEAKSDILKLQSKTAGTEWNEAANYIQRSFGLKDGQVTHSWYPKHFSADDSFVETFEREMRKLDENHATIVTLGILSPGPPLRKISHYVVVYKSMNIIFYFDPQMKIHSTNPEALARSHYNTVTYFGMFHVKGVTTPIPLKTTTCPIKFIGGL